MWDDPEAQSKLAEILDLTLRARGRLTIVLTTRSSLADKILIAGFGVELLLGAVETFEVEAEFRSKVRQINDRWLDVRQDSPDLDRLFTVIGILLDRLAAICRVLGQEQNVQTGSL